MDMFTVILPHTVKRQCVTEQTKHMTPTHFLNEGEMMLKQLGSRVKSLGLSSSFLYPDNEITAVALKKEESEDI